MISSKQYPTLGRHGAFQGVFGALIYAPLALSMALDPRADEPYPTSDMAVNASYTSSMMDTSMMMTSTMTDTMSRTETSGMTYESTYDTMAATQTSSMMPEMSGAMIKPENASFICINIGDNDLRMDGFKPGSSSELDSKMNQGSDNMADKKYNVKGTKRHNGMGLTGPNLGQILDFKKDLAAMNGTSFVIDRRGCHQVRCIGDNAMLKLCNLHDEGMDSYKQYTCTEIDHVLMKMLELLRPDYKADQKLMGINIPFRTRSNCPGSVGEIMTTNESSFEHEGKNPLDQMVEKQKMRLDYMALSTDRMNIMVYNSMKGWGVVIDGLKQEDSVCNPANNFKTESCKDDSEMPCSWDYAKGPIPAA